MIPSLDQTKPEPSDCEVYERSRPPPKKPNGSKNGSAARRRMVASVSMFTTDGRTLCATRTTGVRREVLTVGGMLVPDACGRTGCDSAAGLQARLRANRRMAQRI